MPQQQQQPLSSSSPPHRVDYLGCLSDVVIGAQQTGEDLMEVVHVSARHGRVLVVETALVLLVVKKLIAKRVTRRARCDVRRPDVVGVTGSIVFSLKKETNYSRDLRGACAFVRLFNRVQTVNTPRTR